MCNLGGNELFQKAKDLLKAWFENVNINPLNTGNLANSEDPDEMQHNAAFHQGLHCFLRSKQPTGTEILHN